MVTIMDQITNIGDHCRSPSGTSILWNIYTLSLLLYHVTFVSSYKSGYYVDNGYQTLNRRQLNNWREQEEAIGKELLGMLGIEKKPEVLPGKKTHNSAPIFMRQLYRQLQEDPEDLWDSSHNLNQMHYNLSIPGLQGVAGDADLIMSFQNQASHLSSGDHQHYQFDFSDVSNTESVTKAELRVYKFPSNADTNALKMAVFRINSQNGNTSLHHVAEYSVTSSFEGWIYFDVTDSVQKWLNYPFSNEGFHVTFTDDKGSVVGATQAGMTTDTNPEDLQTFLVAFFKSTETPHVRQRRSAGRERKRGHSRSQDLNSVSNVEPNGNYYNYARAATCHKEALFIRFSDLGWQNWVIAPEGYAAYHCTGQCSFPLNAHMNATNHAIVQTLVSLMETGKVPLPCCAPTKMTAISVLYFDNKSNVILKKYKNMVVKACGCQ